MVAIKRGMNWHEFLRVYEKSVAYAGVRLPYGNRDTCFNSIYKSLVFSGFLPGNLLNLSFNSLNL
jgi:hypothetical protein